MASSRTSSAAASSSAGGVAMTASVSEEEMLRHVLEVAQAPTRGRTCGFGDADRRALSAPLIARLRVYNRIDGTEVPSDDLDISFLVVAADLWSADGTEDMNLVQHPAPHYRKSMSPGPNEGYRPSSSYEDPHRFSYASGGPSGLKPPSSSGVQAEGMPMKPIAFASAGQQPYFGRPPLPAPDHPYPHEPYQTPLAAASASTGAQDRRPKIETPFGSPPFNNFAFQAPRTSPPTLHHQLPPEAELERYPSASTIASVYHDQPSTSTSTVSSFGLRPATMSTRRPSTGATSTAAHTASELFHASSAHKKELEMACVKNLIGALTTNGHKLKPPGESGVGIFFVFHDLSVRTEGTFSIRLRLVSIGKPSSGMHTGSQPVLAECFTPPFEVMSAKKFPGMLDPTPMSQAFAKQGLRIPTRKGANRKRRRPEGQGERESPTPEEDEEEPYS